MSNADVLSETASYDVASSFCQAIFWGAAGPRKTCSLCKVAFYCGTECQRAHWSQTPADLSHKTQCLRIYVRGSKGETASNGRF